MPERSVKRNFTNITECVVRIYGPYEGVDRAQDYTVQSLDFDQDSETIASANLRPDAVYEAIVVVTGEREGKAKLEIQPTDLSKPFAKVGEVKIPKNARKRSPAFGYVHSTSIAIKIPE